MVGGLCRWVVLKRRRGDGEGVEGITRAVARAKVPPVPVRKLRTAIPRQRQMQNFKRVFDRSRREGSENEI